MKPRFLVDQNLSPKTVDFLRKLGYEAKRVTELCLEKATDKEVAEFARDNGLIVITLDKDFGQIYYFSGNAGGTIVLKPALPTVEKINRLLESLLNKIEAERLQKALVIASEVGYRIIEPPEQGKRRQSL